MTWKHFHSDWIIFIKSFILEIEKKKYCFRKYSLFFSWDALNIVLVKTSAVKISFEPYFLILLQMIGHFWGEGGAATYVSIQGTGILKNISEFKNYFRLLIYGC